MYFANYNEFISLDPFVCVTQACDIFTRVTYTHILTDELAKVLPAALQSHMKYWCRVL